MHPSTYGSGGATLSVVLRGVSAQRRAGWRENGGGGWGGWLADGWLANWLTGWLAGSCLCMHAGGGGDPGVGSLLAAGESFPRVDWVAVPEALRARRGNREARCAGRRRCCAPPAPRTGAPPSLRCGGGLRQGCRPKRADTHLTRSSSSSRRRSGSCFTSRPQQVIGTWRHRRRLAATLPPPPPLLRACGRG
jgi:hypothetical protein